MKTAIIIPCRNEGINLKQTLDFILRTEAREKAAIVVIDDGSEDRCCDFLHAGSRSTSDYRQVKLLSAGGIGAARARNLGAEAVPEAEFLIFCDGHILMQRGWVDTLLDTFRIQEAAAACPGIGPFDPQQRAGYGQTWNDKLEIKWLPQPPDITEIPLAPGACLAIKKEAFDAVGGFDRGFESWGYEDVELSLKLWLFGFRIFVNPQVKIGHRFRKTPPYRVDIVQIYYNRLRMAVSHFSEKRICKTISLLPDSQEKNCALAKILLSDSLEQRKTYFKKRVYDDEWFFDKFRIPF